MIDGFYIYFESIQRTKANFKKETTHLYKWNILENGPVVIKCTMQSKDEGIEINLFSKTFYLCFSLTPKLSIYAPKMFNVL